MLAIERMIRVVGSWWSC